MLQRFFLVSSAVLFLASTTAFFLFVPLLSIMTVGSILLGLILMFGLGIQVGTTRIPPSKPLDPIVTSDSHLTAYGYSPGIVSNT